jgi:AraC-like DNA-binding protein
MVPVQRAELVTQDIDLLADLVSQLYVEHTPSFSCPDQDLVDGVLRSGTAGGLNASLSRYGGFAYSAEVSPTTPPVACVYLRGSGVMATAREELRATGGDVFMMPAHLSSTAALDDVDAIAVRIPWAAADELAGASTGLPAGNLRFEAMAPVSPAAGRLFARTADLIYGQLVTMAATEIPALLVQEMTRMTAAAFLETFPNTAMTADYLQGPGWVPPASVHWAAGFIDAYADQPVTLNQIALVAGVTGQALEHAFRRHYGTTPTGYLHRVRLERARGQLQAAEPGDGTTVAAVARQWGWAGSADFAAAYLHLFGVLPIHSLFAR